MFGGKSNEDDVISKLTILKIGISFRIHRTGNYRPCSAITNVASLNALFSCFKYFDYSWWKK